jgi:hypothetical protein
MISHINGPRSLLFDGIVCDIICSGIVGDDFGGWLRIAHTIEVFLHDGALFAVDKEGPIFGFGRGGGNMFENAGRVLNGAIVEVWFAVSVANVTMASGAAAGFGFIQIASVGW